MNRYPAVANDDPKTLKKVLEYICRERGNDINDWNGLPQRFIGGRKVAKIPSDSADTDGNTVGDYNVTTSYVYFCVDNSGTPEWVRVGVSTF